LTGVRRFLVVLAAAGLLALPAAAAAAPREISVGDNFFSPKKPPARSFQAGSSFHWSRGSGSNRHNIRQDDKLFRSGNPVSGPINFSIDASAGSYHYYCELHGSRRGGMSGVVRVRPRALPDSLAGEVLVQWADSNTNTGSRFDVRYRVDRGRWRTWRNDTSRFQGNFGRNDHPVNYRPNRHTYKIEVRSERGRVSKRSHWSPALTLGG
jgi:plastocyanin